MANDKSDLRPCLGGWPMKSGHDCQAHEKLREAQLKALEKKMGPGLSWLSCRKCLNSRAQGLSIEICGAI